MSAIKFVRSVSTYLARIEDRDVPTDHETTRSGSPSVPTPVLNLGTFIMPFRLYRCH
jgi:hypothetical protein